MYRDLADAVESLKEKGYIHTFKITDTKIRCEEVEKDFDIDELSISEAYKQNIGTDPGSESTLYALEALDGTKGLLVIGFGMYSNPSKSKIIDQLLKKSST